jgi:peptidoglycan/xylan/chitin deacetylase (PgdA/CDA1 family)
LSGFDLKYYRQAARIGVALGLWWLAALPASAAQLVEPTLHVPSGGAHPVVALTLDACGGATDMRILNTLVDNNIAATVFVTGKWLKRNGAALAVMTSRPDLFEIEDHGKNHVPAVDVPMSIYGIAAAGSPQAVADEVLGGKAAMEAHGLPAPRWYRGATAKYNKSAIDQIKGFGLKIAGYSLNGDAGATLSAAGSEKRISHARDGDVIIAHINQPNHPAGQGVVAGILALKAKGFRFVKLQSPPAGLASGAARTGPQ